VAVIVMPPTSRTQAMPSGSGARGTPAIAATARPIKWCGSARTAASGPYGAYGFRSTPTLPKKIDSPLPERIVSVCGTERSPASTRCSTWKYTSKLVGNPKRVAGGGQRVESLEEHEEQERRPAVRTHFGASIHTCSAWGARNRITTARC